MKLGGANRLNENSIIGHLVFYYKRKSDYMRVRRKRYVISTFDTPLIPVAQTKVIGSGGRQKS